MNARTRMAPLEGTTGLLKEIFSKVMTPMGMVDKVMRVHSLRAHTINGLYTINTSVLYP
ncbi:MAG: hypothetical protein VX399_09625 [SAR324 cluster bacterium]|nr:hypothetical protein [SAR324 cluster bacterium]